MWQSLAFLLPGSKVLVMFFFFFIFSSPSFAANLLQNSNFESVELTTWTSSGGSAQATISSELVHGGTYAIKVQHSKTSSYGFQQTVSDLEAGMFYEFGGYGAATDANVASFFLRVAWYPTTDGSGSQLSSPNDTDKSEQTNGTWVHFSQIIQAPIDAKSAKVRLVLTSKTTGDIASVYFDDIIFQESVAPTPTSTPTPQTTTTPTSTSTPTKIPTPTITKSPTSTLTPLATKQPTPTPTEISEETSEATPMVLGETIEDETASPSSFTQNNSWKPIVISLLLVATGCAILAGVYTWKIAREKTSGILNR